MADATVETALTRVAREESGRVLALLARRFGDVDLADESVQDALVEAARVWPVQGVPANPPGWLLTVAKHKAIDRMRRAASAHRRTMAAARDLAVVEDEAFEGGAGGDDMIDDEQPMADDRLRLVLLCCHPALDRDAQVALTLRMVGGLTTPEIASAFLVPEATLAQRIVRAKRKIRDAGIPLSIPADLDGRVDAVLAVLYLIFNEGYLTRGDRDVVVRVDLVDEAVRLTVALTELLPDRAEVEGLLALELFHRSRLSTRTDALGDLVLLDQQDRTQWDLEVIGRANAVLHRAMRRMQPGPYQLQAVIAGHHANARTAGDTDWSAIAGLYRQLAEVAPSPVVRLNHAVAVAMADGPHAGLAMLDDLEATGGLDGLERYHLLHATRAELLFRAGRADEARLAFVAARALALAPAEQRHLDRRLASLD